MFDQQVIKTPWFPFVRLGSTKYQVEYKRC